MDLVITPRAVKDTTPTDDTSRDSAEISPEISDKSYKALYDHFGLDESEHADKQLQAIWEYASKMSNSKDKDEVIWQVVKLNHKIGQGDGRTKDHVKLSQYITAWKRMEEAERVVKDMEGR